jgi:hypothetical protein
MVVLDVLGGRDVQRNCDTLRVMQKRSRTVNGNRSVQH